MLALISLWAALHASAQEPAQAAAPAEPAAKPAAVPAEAQSADKAASPPADTGEEKAGSKVVEIEWEEVPNAESYIVKLTPVKAAPGAQPLYFTVKEAKLAESVPVGTYELRIRSRSKEADVYSAWSDPAMLEVAVKEARPLSPADKSTIEARSKLTETVTFSWTPVDKVKEYTITIWTGDLKDPPVQFTTRATKKTLTVKTGRDYFWQVRFESSSDVSYAQMPPIFTFTLVGPKLIKPLDIKVARVKDEQVLTWAASEDAREYKAKLLFHYLDELEYKPVKEVSVKTGQWNAGKLKAGVYKFEVTARAPSRVDSDAAVYEFYVKPTEAELMQR